MGKAAAAGYRGTVVPGTGTLLATEERGHWERGTGTLLNNAGNGGTGTLLNNAAVWGNGNGERGHC